MPRTTFLIFTFDGQRPPRFVTNAGEIFNLVSLLNHRTLRNSRLGMAGFYTSGDATAMLSSMNCHPAV
jgi:hypothetical protein